MVGLSGSRPSTSFVVLLAVAAAVAFAIASAQPGAAAPDRATLLARPDQQFDQDYANMVTKQDQYRAKHGRYWQGLQTHSKAPGATSTSPDLWFNVPTDQRGYGWGKMISFANMPYSMRVDVYSGPDGDGWVLCAQVTEGGQTLERCQGDGAENRDRGWQVVTP